MFDEQVHSVRRREILHASGVDAAVAPAFAASAALELPGAGVARYASSPREYRCASDGEVQSALYNAACCHAQLGNAAEALEALEGAMENGFDDFDAALADDDLAPAGKGKLEELINKFNNPVGKLFRKTTKGKRSATSWLRLGF